MPTSPRPYRCSDHLRSTITTDGGAIAVRPIRTDLIYFDIAQSSHLPANLPDGERGSRVLDIGKGVQIRASGHAVPNGDGWTIRADTFHASQYPTGRDLTAAQTERARSIIGEIVGDWASRHAGDIAQAEDIARNNGARSLEEKIARHEEALKILRKQLRACDNGRPFSQYPDLPTDGR
jgi:hypothetical protein